MLKTHIVKAEDSSVEMWNKISQAEYGKFTLHQMLDQFDTDAELSSEDKI